MNIFDNYRKLFNDSFIKSGKEYGLTEDTYINTMRYNIKKYHKCLDMMVFYINQINFN